MTKAPRTSAKSTTKPAAKVRRSAKTARAPRVGLVSLGCPKALVDSERIITQAALRGLRALARLQRCRRRHRQHLRLPRQRQGRRASTPSAKPSPRTAASSSPAAWASTKPASVEAHPRVLAVTGPHQYEAVVSAVHDAVPPLHDPFVDLVPPEGLAPHAAPLRLFENLRGLQQPLLVLHHPRPARRSRQPPRQPRRWQKPNASSAPASRNCSSSARTPAPTASTSSMPRARGRAARSKPSSSISPQELGALGAWVRLHYVYPYPHVDDVIPLMAEGKILPYLDIPFQHASPKVLKAMKRPGSKTKCWSASKPGARSAQTWRSARPSSSASPAKPKTISKCCSTSSKKPRSPAPAASSTSPLKAPRPTALTGAVPEEVKDERWHRFMARAEGNLSQDHASPHRPHHRRADRRSRRRRRHRPLQVGRTGNRRQRLPQRRHRR